jgi:hypothetical protein
MQLKTHTLCSSLWPA